MFEQWTAGRYDRHISFDSPKDVLHLLQTRMPKSCFYSTAYYGKPKEWKMVDKDWKGADLIFDLDGDHLDFVDPFNIPEMLEIIQLQTWKLWDEFLHPEFGFSEEHLHITFSGHRGFHLHYRDPAVLGLDSPSRRELVSYIRGIGIEVSALMNNDVSHGWKQRLDLGTETILSKLDIVHQDDKQGKQMAKELCGIIKERSNAPDSKVKSCSANRMKTLAESVQHPERRANVIDGKYKGLGKNDHLFLELVKGDKSLILGQAGETDDAVTVDVKRQIRWPTSLNGKCGLQVTSFPLERLHPDGPNPFDALKEALPYFDNKTRELEITIDRCVLGFGGEHREYALGDTLIADANIDTFLTLKGWAKPVSA
jgi:DNA primase small subunit